MTEVIPGVLRLLADNPGPMTLSGTCTYLLGSGTVMIVDPGPAGQQQMDLLVKGVAGRPVGGILLTHSHRDHSGAAQTAAETFSAPIMASEGTLGRLRLEGLALADEAPITPGDLQGSLIALHTAGHSADHVSFFFEPALAVFTGDLILGSGSSAVLYPDGSVTDYLNSLLRLAALEPRILLPGHGPPVQDAAGRLREYSGHRLNREEQILAAVRGGADTVAAVRGDVYGPLAPALETAAELSICAHLHRLVEGPSVGRDESERLRALRDECERRWGLRPDAAD
ncbi:MAG: MBL fold metallo-hydrolase [Gemmatimonadota bacterium]